MVGSSASLGFVRAGFIFVKSPCRRGFSFQQRDGRARRQSYHTTSKSRRMPWTSGSKKVVGILTRCPTASKPQRSVSVSMVMLSFSRSVTELPSVPGAATLRKKSHRGNNRTQVTSQGLSYFVTTMHLLFYLHDIVLLFVCDNCFTGTGSAGMPSKIKITNKVPRVSLCGET